MEGDSPAQPELRELKETQCNSQQNESTSDNSNSRRSLAVHTPCPSHPRSAPTDVLTCTALSGNPVFTQLKSCLDRFYREGGRAMHPGKSQQWTVVLYSSLFRLLQEVVSEKDLRRQLSMLDDAQRWFNRSTSRCSPAVAVSSEKLSSFPITRSKQSPRSACVRSVTPTVTNPRSCPDTRRPSKDRVSWEDRVHSAVKGDLTKIRAARCHQRSLDRWSIGKSRREELELSRQETNRLHARAEAPVRKRLQTPSTAADSSLLKSPTVIRCYEPGKAESEYSAPAEEHFPAVMDKVKRVRTVHRDVYQDVCSSGYYHFRYQDSLSAYYPRVDQSIQSSYSVNSSCDRSLSPDAAALEVEGIRKKLARAQVPCSYRALSFALSKPQDLPESALLLPKGGEYLSSNPFFAKKRK